MADASAVATQPDLRRAPLADVRAIDYRAAARDLWADEAALWARRRLDLAMTGRHPGGFGLTESPVPA